MNVRLSRSQLVRSRGCFVGSRLHGWIDTETLCQHGHFGRLISRSEYDALFQLVTTIAEYSNEHSN
jgi:hypothetical protein